MTETQMVCPDATPAEYQNDMSMGVMLCCLCLTAVMNEDVQILRGYEYCAACLPTCVANGCTNKQHELSDELCAKCEYEIACDDQKAHLLSQPVPMTDEWVSERDNHAVAVAKWKGRL